MNSCPRSPVSESWKGLVLQWVVRRVASWGRNQLVDGLERRRVVDEARDVANEAEATFFDDLRGTRRIQRVQFRIRDAFVRALFGVAYYGHLEGATGPLWL